MSIYSLLKSNPAVAAITDKIYITQAPQGTSPPYVVVRFTTVTPEKLMAEAPNIEEQSASIDCIESDQIKSVALYNACNTALELSGYEETLLINGERDSETGYYRTLFDYSFWNDR